MAIKYVKTNVAKIFAGALGPPGKVFDDVFDTLREYIGSACVLEEFIFEDELNWELTLVAQVDDAAA